MSADILTTDDQVVYGMHLVTEPSLGNLTEEAVISDDLSPLSAPPAIPPSFPWIYISQVWAVSWSYKVYIASRFQQRRGILVGGVNNLPTFTPRYRIATKSGSSVGFV